MDADTNTASHYYNAGLAWLEKEPDRAADAFYWATKLNPLAAENYYARRIALLMSDTRRLTRYWQGDRGVLKSKEVKYADSLYFYALTLNPFFYQKLDNVMFRAIVREIADEMSGRGRGSAVAAEYEIETYLRSAPASFRAWRAYSSGNFPMALELYAQAIRSARRKAGLRVDRGRIFYQINKADSALTELTLAMDEMRKRDAKDAVYFYESKALVEQSIGMAHVRLGNIPAAKEAFGRALQEDLSYFPAHVQLSLLALGAKDTTTAVSEMDLAVQIRADDPALRYLHGYVLHSFNRMEEAEIHARKAIELNPVYAASFQLLGSVLEAQQKPAEALAAYKSFVALASRFDTRLPQVMERVKALQQGSGGA